MSAFEWMDHHWIVAGLSVLLLAWGFACILYGVARRIAGDQWA